jgi:hypothetical protein
MVERIIEEGIEYAIIIRNNYHSEGLSFFTKNEASMQLGYMKRPRGEVIQAHQHPVHKREVYDTQEVLIIKSGILKVDIFNNNNKLVSSKELVSGDIILLSKGYHSFEMIETVEMIEVKQGPYIIGKDKIKM